jgi:hypothetical protein
VAQSTSELQPNVKLTGIHLEQLGPAHRLKVCLYLLAGFGLQMFRQFYRVLFRAILQMPAI